MRQCGVEMAERCAQEPDRSLKWKRQSHADFQLEEGLSIAGKRSAQA